MNKLIPLLFCLSVLLLPVASAQVTAGGNNGNVTFINPDNSTIYFDNVNASTFAHISNYPDGWWNFPDSELVSDEELWVFGVVFGIIAIAFVIAFTVMKSRGE